MTRCVDLVGETRGRLGVAEPNRQWLREEIYFDHFQLVYSTVAIALLEASITN
jgi:hypothetical protein